MAEQQIQLQDNFSIEKNSSTSATGDSYHTFTLGISEYDKTKIINQIKASANFTTDKAKIDEYLYLTGRNSDSRITQNYETKEALVREYFQSNKEGYGPTFRRISVHKRKE